MDTPALAPGSVLTKTDNDYGFILHDIGYLVCHNRKDRRVIGYIAESEWRDRVERLSALCNRYEKYGIRSLYCIKRLVRYIEAMYDAESLVREWQDWRARDKSRVRHPRGVRPSVRDTVVQSPTPQIRQ
jgi:chemotaxis regulatin CheY-phosphate phosphatase CheZ